MQQEDKMDYTNIKKKNKKNWNNEPKIWSSEEKMCMCTESKKKQKESNPEKKRCVEADVQRAERTVAGNDAHPHNGCHCALRNKGILQN